MSKIIGLRREYEAVTEEMKKLIELPAVQKWLEIEATYELLMKNIKEEADRRVEENNKALEEGKPPVPQLVIPLVEITSAKNKDYEFSLSFIKKMAQENPEVLKVQLGKLRDRLGSKVLDDCAAKGEVKITQAAACRVKDKSAVAAKVAEYDKTAKRLAKERMDEIEAEAEAEFEKRYTELFETLKTGHGGE